ncbi:MAG: pyridoxal-phosphate dependent enzyme [Planctomycetaceae bacterium]
MGGAINRATEMAEQPGTSPQAVQQSREPGHSGQRLVREIWADTDGRVDILVAGVGTGGISQGSHVSGSRTRRRHFTRSQSNRLAACHLRWREGATEFRASAGFIPNNLDLSIIDETVQVTDDEAFEMAARVAKEEGITCGISCGANMTAALKVAAKPENAGKTIVVILPDSGERYLSTSLFDACR